MNVQDDQHVVKTIEREKSYQATKWEQDFLKSISGQMERGTSLTTGQRKVMMTIYRKAFFDKHY